jgi:hypothetical protein
VADELDVPFASVNIVQGDTALTPDQGPTFGSLSIQIGGVQIRNAAAKARSALIELAAAQLGAQANELTVAEGVIRSGGKHVSYGELIGGKTFSLTLDHKNPPPTKDAKAYKVVGTSVPRLDIPEKVTGRFTYMHDFRVPGMLHGRVVRPPAIGATLESVDDASVGGIPGVVKVVREANFLGVVAESEWAAIKATQQLKATWSSWQGLPEQSQLFEYVRASKVAKDGVTANVGNTVEAMSKEGVKKLSATYEFTIHTHGSIGPSCAVAEFKDDKLTSWSASQATHNLQKQLAKMFALPLESVRCIYVEGSGCYGRNGHEDAAADAALLAKAVGRPVRAQWSRADEHGWNPKGPPTLIDLRASVDVSGTVTAWDSEFFMPQQTPNMFVVPLVAATLSGMPADETIAPGNVSQNSNIPYKFANIKAVCHRLETTPFRPSWIRTPGRMQNTFANECFMDELAAAAGPAPIRSSSACVISTRTTSAVSRSLSASPPWRSAEATLAPRRQRRPERRRGQRPWRFLLQVRAGAHLRRRHRRSRGQALDGRDPRHARLCGARLWPDHQSGRSQEPDRRQRDPDCEPHAQGRAEVQPLDGDEPRLGDLPDPHLPRGAGDRHGSDRSTGGEAVGRWRAVGGGRVGGDFERGVRCDRRAPALGAFHAGEGQSGIARRRLRADAPVYPPRRPRRRASRASPKPLGVCPSATTSARSCRTAVFVWAICDGRTTFAGFPDDRDHPPSITSSAVRGRYGSATTHSSLVAVAAASIASSSAASGKRRGWMALMSSNSARSRPSNER